MTKNFQIALHHIITASQQAKDAGNEGWWRPLEAGLAAVGAQSESILECVEDQEAAGSEKPIDIDYILLNVIPSILTLSGNAFELKCVRQEFADPGVVHLNRASVPSRSSLRVRQSVLAAAASSVRRAVP